MVHFKKNFSYKLIHKAITGLLLFCIISFGFSENAFTEGSKSFKKGYKDGCRCGHITAGKNKKWKQDYQLFNNNPDYKNGWRDGFFKCLGEIKSTEKTEEAVRIADFNNDILDAQLKSYFFWEQYKAFAMFPLIKSHYRWAYGNSSAQKAKKQALKGCGFMCILFADGNEIIWEQELGRWEQKYIEDNNSYAKGLDKYKNTILHYVSSVNHLGYAKRIIKNNADINITNTDGTTPIYTAISFGHYDMAKFLIKNGADINKPKSSSPNFTPLMIAAYKGHADLIKLLIENGADISLKNQSNATAADIAKMEGHADIQKLLEN